MQPVRIRYVLLDQAKWDWSLPDGTPLPNGPDVGDAWYELQASDHGCPWSNCDGRHLMVMLPDKPRPHRWSPDWRASNCGSPSDREHRCWVRHGDPAKGEALHVDKAGRTCNAGAGSIGFQGWHGFVDRGFVTEQRR